MAESSRDVVIIGGGPAGITTALALAKFAPRHARRVVVLEKYAYPRDKYCAGAVGGRGLRILEHLGALPDTPFVPIDGMSFRGQAGFVEARVDGIGRVVRRIEFDYALARVARERGIAIEDGVKVESVQDRPGDDTAVLQTSCGVRHGSVVVGADGVGSVVRRSMGLSAGTLRAQVLEVDTEVLPGDGPPSILHFDASDPRIPGYAWDFPTVVESRPMVSRGVYVLRRAGTATDADLRDLLGERLARKGLRLADYENKRFAERGFDVVERVALGRRMLVGEAAGIDPVTGEGIAQAIECGFLAGRYLAWVLAGRARPNPTRLWPWRLRTSRLAVDLLGRQRFVGQFYGPPRLSLENLLLSDPEYLEVGCEHFGGLRHRPMQLARVGVKVLAFLARPNAYAASSTSRMGPAPSRRARSAVIPRA
jgi:flavin-dependent dehydrogenase